jgi:predicted nucleic acid-binding protein
MGMSRVFWDSNLFVYLFEQNSQFSAGVKSLLTRMEIRGDQLFTSALTVGEVLAKPYERGDMALCTRYENAMQQAAVILPFDRSAARQFAKLRAQRALRIRPPDAMQLACAGIAGMDLFLTNDTRLHSMKVDGIQFITSVERAPL